MREIITVTAMNEEVFARELAKYKIVRRADHHKIRDKKKVAQVVAKPAAPAVSTTTARAPLRVTGGQGTSFWSIMESTVANSGVLTDSEVSVFLQKLRKEQTEVSRHCSLDDLNTISEVHS